MSKKNVIMQIRSAKAAHMRWKTLVDVSLRNIIIRHNQENLPIVQTECEFGKWYYGDGMDLSILENYQKLEYPHEMLHEIYIQIFTLKKAKLRGGFFTSKKRLLKKRNREIARLHEGFNDFSRIIIETLKQLEMDILSMSNDEFNKMIAIDENESSDQFSDGFDLFIKKID